MAAHLLGLVGDAFGQWFERSNREGLRIVHLRRLLTRAEEVALSGDVDGVQLRDIRGTPEAREITERIAAQVGVPVETLLRYDAPPRWAKDETALTGRRGSDSREPT